MCVGQQRETGQVGKKKDIKKIEWHTFTGVLGDEVNSIWEKYTEQTDINVTDANLIDQVIVTVEDCKRAITKLPISVPNFEHFNRYSRFFCQHNIQLRRVGVGGLLLKPKTLEELCEIGYSTKLVEVADEVSGELSPLDLMSMSKLSNMTLTHLMGSLALASGWRQSSVRVVGCLVLPVVSMDSVPASSCFHFLARVSILGGSASGRLCASLYEAYVALSSSYFACFSRRADPSIYTNAKKVYIIENKELLTSDHKG